MALNVALGIGGTFTDLIIVDESTGSLEHAKSSTTPHHAVSRQLSRNFYP